MANVKESQSQQVKDVSTVSPIAGINTATNTRIRYETENIPTAYSILSFLTSCSQSELAENLNETYALKRTFSSSYVELSLDSGYGQWVRLNEYQMEEKRIYYFFEIPNVTFEVSGEGAVNPDLITAVWDGKKN